MMTNDARKSVTLRLKTPIDQKLSKTCDTLGVSKNAFITMLLSEKLDSKEGESSKAD